MTIGTVRTQGTELFLLDTMRQSFIAEALKFACPTGISGLGGPRDQIDDTCLDATTDKTFKAGLATPAPVAIPFNFIPSSQSHQILFDLKADGRNINWMACLSDGVNPPTITDGDFTPPANRTSVEFNGYVADVNIDIATNEIVKGTLTIQRSGAVVWHYLAPTPTV